MRLDFCDIRPLNEAIVQAGKRGESVSASIAERDRLLKRILAERTRHERACESILYAITRAACQTDAEGGAS